jgi:hypothetical protein
MATASRVHAIQGHQDTGDDTRQNSGRYRPKSIFPEENQTYEKLM